MDEPLSFERIKSAVLSLTQAQRIELMSVLATLTAPKTSDYGYGLRGSDLYEEIRRVLNARCRTGLPDLRTLRKQLGWMPSKLAEIDKAMEEMLGRDLPKLSRQQHDSIKAYLVNSAVDYLQDRPGGRERPVLLNEVLDVLAVPSQLVDEQFPGYRQAGVLREMLVKFVTRKGA